MPWAWRQPQPAWPGNMPARTAAIQTLNQRLRAGLAHFPEVVLNSPASAVPEVVNFSENCIKSETMLAFLAERKDRCLLCQCLRAGSAQPYAGSYGAAAPRH